LRSLRLENSQFRFVISNLEFKKSDILESFLILDLTSGKSVLKDLNLLIKESQLIISSNELSTKNISFVDDILVILLDLLDFLVGELDDGSELFNLSILLNSDLIGILELLLPDLGLSNDFISVFHLLGHVGMFNGQSLIFGFNLILKLRDLMGCNLEFSLKLSDFILSFNQVLRVEISI